MKIVLYANGLDHPEAILMDESLRKANINFSATTDRPLGPISAQPCICALFDNDFVARSWTDANDLDAVSSSAHQDGTPPEQISEPSQPEPTKADLLVKIQELLTAVQALSD